MAIFKKSQATFVEKMNVLKDVTISEDKVKFNLGWSNIDLTPEEIPQIVSDLIQVYGMIKPILDEKSEAKQKELDKTDKESEEKFIDLSEIPF